MNPDQQRIFDVIKANTLKVLPGLDPGEVHPERSLAELGANSVDRVEVVMYSMEDLRLKIPRSELQGIQNLQGLVEVFDRHGPGA